MSLKVTTSNTPSSCAFLTWTGDRFKNSDTISNARTALWRKGATATTMTSYFVETDSDENMYSIMHLLFIEMTSLLDETISV